MTIRFLFFPFTHISESQLRIVLTFFPAFEYLSMTRNFDLRPDLRKLSGQGKITPFFLSYDQAVMVKQNLEQYMEWARIHEGNEVNLKSLLKDTPYFTDDSDVAAIKSKLRKGKDGKVQKKASLSGEPTLKQDLLFLKMAQLYDEQNEGIDLALKNLDTSHDTLISTLRGLDGSSSEGADSMVEDNKDMGGIMTSQRIQAWSRCMAAMGGLNRPGEGISLFITTSEAVFDYLESNCKDVINALDIDKIKVHENGCENKNEWHHHFCAELMRAVQGDGYRINDLPKVTDKCCLSGQIKLYIFSGNTINSIFSCPDKQVFVCLVKLK